MGGVTWEGKRRATLPSDWRKIRARILRRDPLCRLALDVCTGRSTEVDHIGDPGDHRPANLRGVCSECHKRRTAQQAADAKPTTKRPTERHPGLL